MIGNNKTKCVIYCRYSSKTQEKGGSIQSQITSCRNYCHIVGYQDIECFKDEGKSGGILERKGIEDMFEFIDEYNKNNKDKIEIVLIDDFDRIARDVVIHMEIKRQLKKRGVKIEAINTKYDDTPMGKFIEIIMAGKSQFYREENRERVYGRQKARLEDGYWCFDYPIGYKTVNAEVGGKLLVLDEEEAPIIKEGLEGFANGVFPNLTMVGDFFERKGLKMKRRQKSRKKEGNKFHTSVLYRMVRNILYAGYIEYHNVSRNKDGSIKYVWDVSLRKGKHQGIISLETFYKIQEKIDGNSRNKGKHKMVNEMFPLRGFLVCDCCSLPLSSGLCQGKLKKIPYYTFNKRCIHKNKSINSIKLHKSFEKILEGLKPNKEYLEYLKKVFYEEIENREGDKILKKNTLQKNIEGIDKEIDKLVEKITETSSKTVMKKFDERIEELELQKNKLIAKRDSVEDIDYTKTIDLAIKIIENPLLIWQKANIDDKMVFLNLVFRNNLKVSIQNLDFLTPTISPLFSLNQDILSNEKLTFGDDGNGTRVGK